MFIKYFQCIHPDKINVRNSAAGTASQTPVIPRKYGNVTRQITRKKSVLENEIIADTFPFDNAVKISDEMMLIPLNKKFNAKIRNPTDASLKVAGSLVRTDTINPEHRTDNTTMKTEQTQVNYPRCMSRDFGIFMPKHLAE